jgi:hypothetical protein
MWKNNFRKLSFAIAALTILTILLYAKPSASQTTYNWKWSPQVAFRLPAYNTVITFNDWAYLDSFQRDTMNATLVKFVNFQIAGDESPLPSFGLSVQNANCTVNYVNRQGKAEVVLSAASGTVSILTLYYPNNYPPTIVVNGEAVEDSKYFRSLTDWQQARCPAVFLDEANMKVQVKAQHSSPVTVTIYWHGFSITPTPVTPTPMPPTPQPPKPVVVPPEAAPIVNVGLIVVIVAAVGVYAYIQATQPRKVREKWKQKLKQARNVNVKWKRKKRFRTLEE